MMTSYLRSLVKDVPEFPKSGVMFRDLTPLWRNPAAMDVVVGMMAGPYLGQQIDLVVAPESRGFIMGAAVARVLGAGFVPVRKPGKLPRKVKSRSYTLEYRTDQLEIHEDAIQRGQRVLLVDDVLATGGTLRACAHLVEDLQGITVGFAVVIELPDLKGRIKLDDLPGISILQY